MQKKKSRAGRPRTKKASNYPIHGIIDKPIENDKAILEVIYDNPMVFKKIFALFNKYNIETIDVFFTKTSFKLCACNESGTIRIYIEFDGKKLNSYYCVEPIHIYFDSSKFYQMFQYLSKKYSKITFLSYPDSIDESIIMYVYENSMDKMTKIMLDLVGSQKAYPWKEYEEKNKSMEEEELVKFTIPSKDMKDIISEVNKVSDNIEFFIHQSSGNLTLRTHFTDKRGNYSTTYLDNDKINCKNKLEEDELLSTRFNIDIIKPFILSQIASSFDFVLDSDHNILMIGKIDSDEDTGELGKERIIIKMFIEGNE